MCFTCWDYVIPEGEAAEVTIENNGKKHKLKDC